MLSHITDDGRLLNFDESSGYVPIDLKNVFISFLAEKPVIISRHCLKSFSYSF